MDHFDLFYSLFSSLNCLVPSPEYTVSVSDLHQGFFVSDLCASDYTVPKHMKQILTQLQEKALNSATIMGDVLNKTTSQQICCGEHM